MKRMIDNKAFNELKQDVKDVEGHTSDYVITSVVVEDEEILGTQVKDVENDITYNLPLGSQVEANPTLVGTEEALEGIGIDGTNYKVGGGKQLYQHNISIVGDYKYITISITNEINTAFTIQTLNEWLIANGYANTNTGNDLVPHTANGTITSSYTQVRGVYGYTNTALYDRFMSVAKQGAETPESIEITASSTFKDKVRAL